MLRITEIRLPIDHPESMIRHAVLEKLGIHGHELIACTIFRRGTDARRQNRITFIYTLDVETLNEDEILARMAGDPHVRPAPDTR